MTINDMPKKLVLTCTLTNKRSVWTNRQCMLKAAQKHGSLEAFIAQYTSKGAKKKDKPSTKALVLKPVLTAGVALGKLSQEEYTTKYVTRHYPNKDGSICTVVAPPPPAIAT